MNDNLQDKAKFFQLRKEINEQLRAINYMDSVTNGRIHKVLLRNNVLTIIG